MHSSERVGLKDLLRVCDRVTIPSVNLINVQAAFAELFHVCPLRISDA